MDNRLIDVVQLTMRDGILSLNKPMVLARQTLADLSIQLRQFLDGENALLIRFEFKINDSDINVALNATELRWVERSATTIITYTIWFETGQLTENGDEIPAHRTATFLTKIDQLLNLVRCGHIRVSVKARGARL